MSKANLDPKALLGYRLSDSAKSALSVKAGGKPGKKPVT